jgi:hypothetical protein
MTANQVHAAGAAVRPLAESIGVTLGAVQQMLNAAEPHDGYRAIARLSGHLAAMWRIVYPRADSQRRAECLARGRQVEWALRMLECQLAGAAFATDMPAPAVFTLLARELDSYRPAEQALVTWVEDQLAGPEREKLARAYCRAFGRAPTRPHPRSPRSGPLRQLSFWARGSWDRVLDTMDARPGVGRDFPDLLARSAAPAPGFADEDPADAAA